MGCFSRKGGKDGPTSDAGKSQGDDAQAMEEGPSGAPPSPQPSVFSIWFASHLWWIWLTPFMKLGNRRAIQENDLYLLKENERTRRSYQDWCQSYQKVKTKDGLDAGKLQNVPKADQVTGGSVKVPRIVGRILVRSFGREYFTAALNKPVWLIAVIMQVYVLKGLVNLVSKKHQDINLGWGIFLVIAMFLTSVVQSLTQHHCFTGSQRVGMKIRSAVSMAVFDKLLVMRSVALGGTTSGEMMNLLTNDTQKLLECATYFHFVWHGVVEMIVVCIFAVIEAGPAALGGVAIIVLINPIQAWMASVIGKIRNRAVKLTDARVRLVSEVLTGVRVVKYNGWSGSFLARIQGLRSKEMAQISHAGYLRSATSTIKDTITPLASLVTFWIYVSVHGGALRPAVTFATLAFFSILVRVFSLLPTGVQFFAESLVAIRRLDSFLALPNGNDKYSSDRSLQASASNPDAAAVLSNGTFSWSLISTTPLPGTSHDSGTPRPSFSGTPKDSGPSFSEQRSLRGAQGPGMRLQLSHSLGTQKKIASLISEGPVLRAVEFALRRGELVAITGAVGAGKSSLLQAIMGEMECLDGAFWKSEPAAYCPQQPWILNDTIRNNITFGEPYDASRYAAVTHACALDHDIANLPGGHETEIGERGVTLSGGQKARLSLARALYSRAQLLLLDDPLSAVDVPTGRHLTQHALTGPLAQGRARLLVTHQRRCLSACDRVMLMEGGTLRLVESEEELRSIGAVDDDLEGIEEEPIHTSEERVEGHLDSGRSISGGGAGSAASERGGSAPVLGERRLDESAGSVAEARGGLLQDRGAANLHSERKSASAVAEERGGQVPLDLAAVGGVDENAEAEAQALTSASGGSVTSAEVGTVGRDVTKADGVAPLVHGEGTSGAKGQQNGVKQGWKSGQTVVKEDRVEGVVTRETVKSYISAGGGYLMFATVMIVFLIAQGVRVMGDWWLAAWTDQTYQLSAQQFMASYLAFVVGGFLLALVRAFLFTFFALNAAAGLHDNMATHILRAPQVFFDQNPVGRILNRFGKDQSLVDEFLPSTAQVTLELLCSCLGSVIIIGVLVPWFLLVLPPLIITFRYLQRMYVSVSREVKRLEGTTRSPVFALFGAALQGVDSVRAYCAQERFKALFEALIDVNHRCYILFVHGSRWLGVRLDLLAALCVTVAAACVLILRNHIAAGIAGVVLVQSLQLTGLFQYGVRQAAETENFFTSVERISAYTVVEDEEERAPSQTAPVIPDKSWPQDGVIEFRDVTMAYRTDLPPVLRGLSFKVNGREKVGVLGRTGAGKSSLVSNLFRMVYNESCGGEILIDGIDIRTVPLDLLRSKMSIIPQDPVLFEGTVRQNLDPFSVHSDEELLAALDRAHLKTGVAALVQLKKGATEESILKAPVVENGNNFSVGQRQLLCLARALLRNSRVVVMDEATAAVDHDTDQLIQAAVRDVFDNCTVLTIAHRLETIIDCDRVLVLAKGQLAEFDTPVNLLRSATREQTGIFAGMVAQTGSANAEQLLHAAEEAERTRFKRTAPSHTSA
ncbi:ATP-binding cassette transporter subfamily C [Klebsormidium nitens]|uniref:ATP-binding cassette transporter subfamily C n=1 Tax=Klebsormidium nitens TaxID=105231 RepID=A0A1Y1IEQ5_KLENI|nr:ATP-binding cassette transporter subfamily C [Klebsormidium nitens]|eukprot:GAQ87187.1 ATP-binding cassette transporter subfamily C [Klebsormidium nitens]